MVHVTTTFVCFVVVELLRMSWEAPVPPTPEAADDNSVAIAVPPKPEGAAEQGSGSDSSGTWTEQRCRQLSGELRDVCFHQLARGRAPTDLTGALVACEELESEKLRAECMADVAELHSPTDRDAALAVCPEIGTKKWRDQCVFGIALALSGPDPSYAFRLCDEAGQWYDFCRHDVNGEIAQVDDAMAFANCATEEGDILTRKTCWHGMGKYIARVDVARAWRVCESVPLGPQNIYRENCVHGLAWGAAESAGRAFLEQCGVLPAQRDSCKLGVAYFESRFDTAGALEICDSVERDDLTAKCLEHVRRMAGD
jgi:hypothetical protein